VLKKNQVVRYQGAPATIIELLYGAGGYDYIVHHNGIYKPVRHSAVEAYDT